VATRRFRELLLGFGVERVVYLPLGTDTRIFRPRDSREDVLRELGLGEEVKLLLFVGRFADMKNLPVLLQSLDELPRDLGPFHLLLVGDGEKRDMVARAAAERSDVTWYPYVSDQDMLAEIYSAADLFVNPGTRETFGLVSLEAQACGTRVLGVRDGGMDETLAGEQPLILAEEPTPEALAEAVARIAALRDSEEDRRKRSRRIRETFSLERTFDRLISFYGDLKEGRPLDPWLSL
jgi:alpha-1,6-mannosyltransferase